MAKYFIQDTTLTNIANAIREKAGITTSLFPENMPSYIRGIETGTSDAPDYVVTEVDRVVNDVIAVQNSNTFTFPVTSDIHYSFDSIPDDMNSFTDDIGYAMDLIRNRIYPDFEADMGDKVFGASAFANEDTCGEAIVVNGKLGYADTRMSCLGNHDTYNTTVNQRYAFTCFQNNGAVYGDELNGYCYRDLENTNTRIILLNTSEMGDDTTSSAISMSTAQLKWVCGVLAEMTNKSDYHILFMSHMPPDWGVLDAEPAILKILRAYESGNSYTIDGETFNFSATDRADVIGWCHGHLHNHKTRYIYGTEIWRFCIPTAYRNRANEYSDTTTYPNEEFQELFGNETIKSSSYSFRTATSTAFSVVVVDVVQKCINIINYGAGGSEYNRVIVYGDAVTYSITNNLTNVTTSNNATTVAGSSKYIATISPNSGYEIDTIKVTMGGEDITSTAVNGNGITISSVTGDIVITATGKATTSYNVTNLVLTSEEQSSTAVYNGIGYKNGAYASESGDGTDASCVVTGWIPYTWSPSNVIYIRGASVTTASHVRFYGYNTKTTINTNVGYTNGANLTSRFTIERPEGDSVDYYKLTPINTNASVAYIRISLIGTGDNLIITVNEPIITSGETETTTYTVTNTLTNVTSNNSATTVASGASYSATLTANSGYEIDTIKVTMGGEDITSTAVNGSSISISSVDGNVVIIANATAITSGGYTNLVTTSLATDGIIYNVSDTPGYKNGHYASGHNDGTDANFVVTGFILLDTSTVDAIYIKGAEWNTDGHSRFVVYSKLVADSSYNSYMIKGDGSGDPADLSEFFTVETLDTNYYKWTLTSNGKTYLNNKYYRVSLYGTGDNLIVTHDEPIE